MEELLDAILELVGLVLPEVDDPGPVVAKSRIGVERLSDGVIVDQVEFEREEQEMRARVGHLLLHVAVELDAARVGSVAGIEEAGIGGDAADQFLQRLVLTHGLAETAFGQPGGLVGEPALPTALESDRVLAGPGDVALQFRRLHAGIEVAEIPFGEGTEVGLAGLRGAGAGHRGKASKGFRTGREGHGRLPLLCVEKWSSPAKGFVHRLF